MTTSHAIACRMLRRAGKLDFCDLPPPRRRESVADWLVRAGIAQTPQTAIAGLLHAAGLAELPAELSALLTESASGATPRQGAHHPKENRETHQI